MKYLELEVTAIVKRNIHSQIIPDVVRRDDGTFYEPYAFVNQFYGTLNALLRLTYLTTTVL